LESTQGLSIDDGQDADEESWPEKDALANPSSAKWAKQEVWAAGSKNASFPSDEVTDPLKSLKIRREFSLN